MGNKKIAGVGMKSLIAIAIFTMFFIVCSKAVVNKYNVPLVKTPVNAI